MQLRAVLLTLAAVPVFGASDPAIWGPWRTQSEVVVASWGIGAVSVDQVLEALARLGVRA